MKNLPKAHPMTYIAEQFLTMTKDLLDEAKAMGLEG
jgi:hypothetical protein